MNNDVVVGILQSSSGTMAVSESALIKAALLAIEEINAQGGLFGRPIRALVEDGCSAPGIFAQKAERLIREERVATLFGCWTSDSRKAVKSVVEEHNSLLWYPVQYEGLEQSPNIVYTGSCLNQQIDPALEYCFSGNNSRYCLVGSDYVFPRTANQLIRGAVEARGGKILDERYRPLGSGDFGTVIGSIKTLRPDFVLNTINGGSNHAFFRQYAAAGLDIPVMSFSLSEVDQQAIREQAAGHFACWSYFQSLKSPENKAFIENFQKRWGQDQVCSDPVAMAYAQVQLWRQVALAAGSVDTDAIRKNLKGCSFLSPAGRIEIQENHHLEKQSFIGQARSDGQFDIVWQSEKPIMPHPWLGVENSTLPAHELIQDALGKYTDVLHLNSMLQIEISKRMKAEELIRKERDFSETLIQASPTFIVTIDAKGRTKTMNRAMLETLGYSADEVVGLDYLTTFVPEKERLELSETFQDIVVNNKPTLNENHVLFKDGRKILVEWHGRPVFDDKGEFDFFFGVGVDITERNKADALLKRFSLEDGLTGLANRRQFDRVLDKEWQRAMREKKPLSLIMVDVDHFKKFNDLHGHQQGDECLRLVGECLKEIFRRPADLVARYGGEEFVAILPNTESVGSSQIAESMRKLVLQMELPTKSGSRPITISLGVATMWPDVDSDPTSLVERADQAMYKAKDEGRNRTCVWKEARTMTEVPA